MDIAAILAIIAKGVEVISTAVAVGKNAVPAIEAVKDLIQGAQEGTVTQDQLDSTEASLDSMIADFNTPI